MDERRLEIKVGALLLVAIVGVLGLLYLMGELSFRRGVELFVDFSHTGNVVKGAPVKVGGVEVGRVDAVALLADRRDAEGKSLPVELTLTISEEVLPSLHDDAQVTVSSVGPLGEPYLELSTGHAGRPALARGAHLRGIDAPRLDLVAAQLSSFLDAASALMEENPKALGTLVVNLSRLSETLERFLQKNGGDLDSLVQELSAAARDLRQLSATGRRLLEPGGKAAVLLDDASASAKLVRQELPGLTSKADRALTGLAAVSGELTPEDGVRLKAALASVQQLSARADKILARIEAGEGTIGNLQKDPELAEDLRALVKDLKAHPWKVLFKN